jgi:hypothetical protein
MFESKKTVGPELSAKRMIGGLRGKRELFYLPWISVNYISVLSLLQSFIPAGATFYEAYHFIHCHFNAFAAFGSNGYFHKN